MAQIPEKTSPKQLAEVAFCPMHTAMGVLGGKWKFVILYSLMDGEARRFKVLERSIAGITARMLIKELKSLESEGLVQRTAYPTVPPTVEYRLTPYGISLVPIIEVLDAWGRKHERRRSKSSKAVARATERKAVTRATERKVEMRKTTRP